MKISSKNLNKRKKLLSNKVDTVYMNTDSLFCYNVEKNIETGKNIKKIEISKKMIEDDYEENYISIYDSRATNIYFEGQDNYGDISIPLNYIDVDDVYLEINNENIKSNFKKIKVIDDNKIIFEIELDEDLKEIDIRPEHTHFADLNINIESKRNVIEYIIKRDGEYFKKLCTYNIIEDDLDENNNLDIRKVYEYENITCQQLDINTLIIDKNIFNNINNYYILGLIEKKDYMSNIKKIRFIDNNDMKLIPFDKTFEIKEVLLNENKDLKYLYIKTIDDEVVIYLDNDDIKYISKNKLLKDDSIKNVYFRFRKLSDVGIFFKPVSLIIKEYKNGRIFVDNLIKEYEIDDKFKNNIINNIDALKLSPYDKNYIISNNWLELLLDNDFDNDLYQKILLQHLKEEKNLDLLKSLGFNEAAIEYLRLRGIVENIINVNVKLRVLEVEGYNAIGENYKKVLRKSGD